MAKCHICGQPTESGSVCRHCRAALNRLRERAAPPGDGHGTLALAGATVGGSSASAAAPAGASGFLRRRKEAAASTLASQTANVAQAAKAPAAAGALPKPWLTIVGMGLLVVVGGIAVYQLVDSGSAPVSVPTVARPAEPAVTPPAAVRVLETPAPPPTVVPPTVVAEPPQPATAPAPTRQPKRTTERAPADIEPAAPADAAPASRPASLPAPAPKAAAPSPGAPPVALTVPPQATASTTKARWDRMDAALEECSRREFLNRLICREKVRMEYCEGQWGKIDRCPGTPAIEHGG